MIPHNLTGDVLSSGWLDVLNLPNSITLSRIACVPFLIWVLSNNIFRPGEQEMLAAGIFILASITDGLDGYLARKHGQISSMGMLLDPMADKLLVAAGLILLVRFTPNLMPPWIVVLVLGREFLITGLRSVAATEGFAIQARDLGKLKMVVQIVAVVATILAHGWYEWNFFGFIVGVELIARISIWFMLVVSLLSGVDYFVAFWDRVDRSARRQPGAVVAVKPGVANSTPTA
jgi:CDP-diacylglycerol--glycerol-3-phosphate 3-phosphatidyltransferase